MTSDLPTGVRKKPVERARLKTRDVFSSADFMNTQLSVDAVVVGGGVGGCAAALALADSGLTVVMTEETEWIGGQLTSQAVPPDEHGWIERFGCTATYRRFREAVRDYYRRHYPLKKEVASDAYLNPGNGWVSPLCHEPRVALAVLTDMLAPHVSSGRLRVLTNHRVEAVQLSGEDRVGSVDAVDVRTGDGTQIGGRWFVDATELGDLLPLADVEHVSGQESREDTGEPGAPKKPATENVQAFSMCFAIEHREGEDFVGDPPAGYSRWREYHAPLSPPWPGPWIGWDGLNPRNMEAMQYRFNPHGETPGLFAGLWSFRRVIDRQLFEPGAYASDIVMVNWPMIDYLPGNLIGATEADRKRFIEDASQLSLSVFHWLQTEAPREDGGRGWPGLRLRPDITGTSTGLAMAPYIRESRRIRSLVTISEQDVSAALLPSGSNRARPFEDSVGVGYYRIDLHPSHGGDNYIDVASLPFQIPLGALVPVRMANLLPACKNIGTTHITNGCYRLHPVEWNIGESVGRLVAFCDEKNVSPQAAHARNDLRETLQKRLKDTGVELEWPADIKLEDGDPHAHVMKPR